MNYLSSKNAAMQRVFTLCEGVARVPTTVLLFGESGTGKEVLAQHIHDCSSRRNGPFVAVNCAAIPDSLMESEFFGHEKGAFSGAGELKKGRFELSNGGTLLLDEISELPYNLQAKLLRVIQERSFHRLGGTRSINCDVRIIATTNRDLVSMVRENRFREDLYYRINVFPIEIPPLRQRSEDIPELAEVIISRLCQSMGRNMAQLSNEALAQLSSQSLMGNVRELHNILERALVLTDGDTISTSTLLSNCGPTARLKTDESGLSSLGGLTLAEVERQVILSTLEQNDGNRTRTSEVLGISIRTLRNKLRDYRGAGFEVAARRLGCVA